MDRTKTRKIAMSVYVYQRQLDALAQIRRDYGVPSSRLLRDAIDIVIEDYKLEGDEK